MANPSPGDDRLQDLLLSWEEQRRRGQPVGAEELCRDCPELLEPLRRRISALQAVDAALAFTQTGDATASPAAGDAATRPAPGDRTGEAVAASPERAPELPGYEVLGELGRGGMGVVYKARQVALGRVVALKMILAAPGDRPEHAARFRREVEAVARLHHPNLVQVYEVGEQGGRPYFAMEYVEGGSLDRVTEGRPQPPREAAGLVETLARAMHAAHLRGIVHRDLKPGNILLSFSSAGPAAPLSERPLNEAVPKITDFGLAKQMGAEAGPTVTGDILGTPTYMAPEQAAGKGRDVGPAADVYGLGGILYTLLTGRPPVEGETAWEVINRVVSAEPPPPRRLRPGVPRDLETICLMCLRKEPGKRYGTALALADDLRRYLNGEPIRARPVGVGERAVKWVRRRPAAAALLAVSALACLALAAGGVVYEVQLRRALDEARANAEESRRRLVLLNVSEGGHALDEGDWAGSLLWFAEALLLDRGHPERERMHRRRLGAVLRFCPRLLLLGSHGAPVVEARFSADGRYVITASDDGTGQVWDVGAGGPAGPPLRHGGAVLAAAFRPDGRAAVTAGADGTARVWEVPGGRPLLPPLHHGGPVRSASFSADGRHILTAGGDTARLWDAATGEPAAPPLRHGGTVRCAAFSADGRRVVTASDDATARVWDARTGSPATPPLRHAGPVTCADFDPAGRRVVTASADQTARVWDAATGQPLGTVLRHRAAVARAAFSPDGRLVLTASADHTACLWDAATGQLAAPPLQQESAITTAAFRPDGRRVITASEDNTACLWDAATGDWLPPLVRHQGTVRCAAFSPDGGRILTAGDDDLVRVWDVAALAGAGARAKRGPRGPAPAPVPARWTSPDGRRVVSTEGDHGARVRDAATGAALGPLLRHGSAVLFAAFSADGRRVATASDDDTARLWDADTGEQLTPPLRHKATVQLAAFSPDGTLLVTAAADRTARAWDAATGEPITPSVRLGELVRQVSFGDGGGQVRLTGADLTVWTWDRRPDDRPAADLMSLACVMSGAQMDPARGPLPAEPGVLRRTWQVLRERYPDE
jgi:WD40 repeat protein